MLKKSFIEKQRKRKSIDGKDTHPVKKKVYRVIVNLKPWPNSNKSVKAFG